MAKQTGGILGRPSGQLSGLIFSSARGRKGKITTVREKVNPANPKTPAQQLQRTKFGTTVKLLKAFGLSTYQVDWNRAVEQLPAFQSMQSVVIKTLDASYQFSAIDEVPLGSLHYPESVVAGNGANSGELRVQWSDELGVNGTDADEVVILAYEVDASSGVVVNTSVAVKERGDATPQVDIGGFSDGAQCAVIFYLRGAGTAAGLLTPAKGLTGQATS